jgi:hypothetical protein
MDLTAHALVLLLVLVAFLAGVVVTVSRRSLELALLFSGLFLLTLAAFFPH